MGYSKKDIIYEFGMSRISNIACSMKAQKNLLLVFMTQIELLRPK